MESKRPLFEICKEYVHWVLVAQDCGGGYLANQKRVELHGELADYFGVDEKALDSVLLFLDRKIGLPVNFIISSGEAIDEESSIYGKKLMYFLEKKFGSEKIMSKPVWGKKK